MAQRQTCKQDLLGSAPNCEYGPAEHEDGLVSEVAGFGDYGPARIRATDSDLVLTENEAARLTRLSSRTLQRMAEVGTGPPRIQLTARRVGYWKHDVLAWLQARTSQVKQAA